MGSRRIEVFDPVDYAKVRLRITGAVGTPVIRDFSLYDAGHYGYGTDGTVDINPSFSVGGWEGDTYGADWQDLTLDLTKYVSDHVGQFELEFHHISHDRVNGEWGLEFSDWSLEMYGVRNFDGITATANSKFVINHSQQVDQDATMPVIFRTKVRSRPGKSVGEIRIQQINYQ